MVLERTRELAATQDATILSMATLAETRDPETGHHLQRTQAYVRSLAVQLRTQHPRFRDELDDHAIDLLFKSAPLHDIGKVGVPDSILRKPGKLTPDEYEVMKRHVVYGYEAIVATEKLLAAAGVSSAAASFLRYAREIARSHHEKWDGTGYPDGLGGDEIPLSARLMTMADVYDALRSAASTSRRFPTRRRWPRSCPAAGPTSTPTWSTPSAPWTRSSWRSPAPTRSDAHGAADDPGGCRNGAVPRAPRSRVRGRPLAGVRAVGRERRSTP